HGPLYKSCDTDRAGRHQSARQAGHADDGAGKARRL
ncbi:hypothetical protein ATR1_102c0001, partial [Acetobacter tropicalis]